MNEPVDFAGDELIQAYLDGEATTEQEAEFRRRLAKSAFCRRVAEYATDAGQLYELGRFTTDSPHAVELVMAIEEQYGGQTPPLAMPAPQPTADVCHCGRRPHWRPVLLASVAAGIAIATVALYWQHRDAKVGDQRAAIGRIVQSGGAVVEFQDKLQSLPVLREGDTVRTSDLSGFALIELDDGTELTLSSDTSLVCLRQDGQKHIVLSRGHLGAQVRPQPAGRPLLIVTPLARVEVLGTSLAVSAGARETEVGVRSGRVRMQRLSDGKQVDVAHGQYAVASPGMELRSQPLPLVAEHWSEDFEEGLPSEWRYGQWVSQGLPEGSRGGVRASRWSILEGHASNGFRITTPKSWARGLCSIEADTVLHFTYKMERPGWFHIMMAVRSDGTTSAYVGNYEMQAGRLSRIPANEWRTASVPLSAFRRASPPTANVVAGPPRLDDVACMIWFSTAMEDRGLTIDRIWIDRESAAEQGAD